MDIYIIESGKKNEGGSILFIEIDQKTAIKTVKSIKPHFGPWKSRKKMVAGDTVYYAESGCDWVSVTRWPVPRPDDAMAPKIRNAYVEAARRLHEDEGTVEIDDEAIVSKDPDRTDLAGVYVAAWVWVDDSDAGVCTKCRAELAEGGDGYDGKCGNCMDVEDPPSE